MTLAMNVIKEKIRRKELYVVTGIGLLLLLFVGSDSGSISVGGQPVTGYENLSVIMILVINVVSAALAIVLSLRTIPNEYERKTSHLVWIRGISQPRYHGELAAANMISSVISEAILYLGMLIYVIRQGRTEDIRKLIPAFLIVAIAVCIVSLLTSVLSIVLPEAVAGVIAAICYGVGILHSILSVYTGIVTGAGKHILQFLLQVLPDLYGIQAQAGRIFSGDPLDAHVIWKGLFTLYVISVLIFVFRKKEV